MIAELDRENGGRAEKIRCGTCIGGMSLLISVELCNFLEVEREDDIIFRKLISFSLSYFSLSRCCLLYFFIFFFFLFSAICSIIFLFMYYKIMCIHLTVCMLCIGN